MPSRQQGDQHLIDDCILADNDLSEFFSNNVPGFSQFLHHFLLGVDDPGLFSYVFSLGSVFAHIAVARM